MECAVTCPERPARGRLRKDRPGPEVAAFGAPGAHVSLEDFCGGKGVSDQVAGTHWSGVRLGWGWATAFSLAHDPPSRRLPTRKESTSLCKHAARNTSLRVPMGVAHTPTPVTASAQLLRPERRAGTVGGMRMPLLTSSSRTGRPQAPTGQPCPRPAVGCPYSRPRPGYGRSANESDRDRLTGLERAVMHPTLLRKMGCWRQ